MNCVIERRFRPLQRPSRRQSRITVARSASCSYLQHIVSLGAGGLSGKKRLTFQVLEHLGPLMHQHRQRSTAVQVARIARSFQMIPHVAYFGRHQSSCVKNVSTLPGHDLGSHTPWTSALPVSGPSRSPAIEKASTILLLFSKEIPLALAFRRSMIRAMASD